MKQIAQEPKRRLIGTITVPGPARMLFNIVVGKVSDAFRDQARILRNFSSDDEKLIRLIKLAHEVGDDALLLAHCEGPKQLILSNLAFSLQSLAAFVCAWLAANGTTSSAMMESTFAERRRQDELLRTGKLLFNCASSIADDRRKFRVLIEEIGEVAQAIDRVECCPSRHQLETLKYEQFKETIQVLAVAVAWLEALEGM